MRVNVDIYQTSKTGTKKVALAAYVPGGHHKELDFLVNLLVVKDDDGNGKSVFAMIPDPLFCFSSFDINTATRVAIKSKIQVPYRSTD